VGGLLLESVEGVFRLIPWAGIVGRLSFLLRWAPAWWLLLLR
jgi:hypothetical protein